MLLTDLDPSKSKGECECSPLPNPRKAALTETSEKAGPFF